MPISHQIVPKHFFFTNGVGFADDEITSFEFALRAAKCERFNFVPVSSILPPKCQEVSQEVGLSKLKTGEIVYCVMCRVSTEKKGTPITVAVANATHPKNSYGYFIEHSEYSENDGDFVQNTAIAKKIAYNLLQSIINGQNSTKGDTSKNDVSHFKSDIPVTVIDENSKMYSSIGKQMVDNYTIKWNTATAINTRKQKWMTLLAIAIFTLK